MPIAVEPRVLAGRAYLAALTTLLQRGRAAHPTAGSFEAADLQWWWRSPRSTDAAQLVWFDGDDQPRAAAVLTDWGGDRVGFVPIVLPGAVADAEVVGAVIDRGLAHAAAQGIASVEIEVARDDTVTRAVLADRGFAVTDDGVVESWLATADRPPVRAPADGYRLTDRAATAPRPHHLVGRIGADVEERLGQTSLYRPDLDLVVLAPDGAYAAYGLFWFDPVTATGLVEPMRTEDEHQRRGLARCVLTAGLDRLARAGATRVKICFEPGNPASSHLYVDVGFVPDRRTDVLTGPTA